MTRIRLFFLVLLLVPGCVPDKPGLPENRSWTGTASYQGEMARRVHPVSLKGRPQTGQIDKLTLIRSDDLTGELRPGKVRRNPDLMFPIQRLKSSYPDIDLNERVSQRFLFDTLCNGPFPTMITVSRERYFHLQLDNDIFDYTDRFYTNGIRLMLITPWLSQNPLNYLLIPYWKRGVNYYSLSVVQDMYTPSTTKLGGILLGDRPYAAYLYVASTKITNDDLSRVRLKSEIQLGILGPSSLGEYVQRTFHNAVPTNNEPLGWEFQIQNDLLLNYSARIEKGIISLPGLELLIHGTGTLGTVHTQIGGGTYIRSGWFNSYFSTLFFSKHSLNRLRHARNVQFYFFADFNGKAVGYDATLQGGIFNRSSVYTIPSADISRLMFIGSGGIVFSCGGFQLKGEQFLQSPEFNDGWWHKWLSIGLTFSF